MRRKSIERMYNQSEWPNEKVLLKLYFKSREKIKIGVGENTFYINNCKISIALFKYLLKISLQSIITYNILVCTNIHLCIVFK